MIFKRFWKSNKLDFQQELVEQLRDLNVEAQRLAHITESYYKSIDCKIDKLIEVIKKDE